MIELATEAEHLAGANYVLYHEGKATACETVGEVWKARTGWGPYEVRSPVGLPTDEFIPF